MIIVIVIATVIMTGNEYEYRIWIYDLLKVCVRLYASTTLQRESPRHMSSWKVSERSTKPPGFTVPHYFYIYNISSHDFGTIQAPRAEIYIFTTGTPYKISSRALLPPSLRTGIFTVECACPEPFRGDRGNWRRRLADPQGGEYRAWGRYTGLYKRRRGRLGGGVGFSRSFWYCAFVTALQCSE